MATLNLSRQGSVASDPTKTPRAVNVAVNEVHNSDSDDKSAHSADSSSFSSSFSFTRIIDVVQSIRELIVRDVDEIEEHYFEKVDIDSYLAYIADERLLHLPHRGSSWDKVLKHAEFFGLQVFEFGESIAPFVPESRKAAHTALASCKILLELGHHNAQALEVSFSIFYELGLLIAQTVRTHDLRSANESAKEELGEVYSALVDLVGHVAIHYRSRINSMTNGSVKIDFFGSFGAAIDHIYKRKEHVSNHMWALKLRHKKYSLSIESIRRKLKPVDQSARSLLLERFAVTGARAEGTCEWAQGYLLDFFRSTDQVFTITGSEGCGKSTLAGWIKDRLQRPLGRKSYETIAYRFPFDATAEATSLACIKSLLSQLLDRNVGDIKLYEALVKAYEAFSRDSNVKKLEDNLWAALQTGLGVMYSSKVNMVVIVDGLDEITGGEDAARELQGRVLKAVKATAGTRAITLSRPISHLTSGGGAMHFTINKDQTHDDIEAYVQQALHHERLYKDQASQDRAKFVDNLVHKAKGSFLWASLVLRSLRKEESKDAFMHIAHNTSSSVEELVASLASKVDFKNTTTKAIFTLLLAAERPFSTSELSELLQVNVQKLTFSSERIDVRKHIKEYCSHFITERQGVVRFRHSTIRKLLLAFASQGKFVVSLREAHAELTIRMLLYAKLCLTTNYEPTIDGLTITVVEETFHNHKLMEYVVRSWLSHFRLSSLYTAKGELSLTTQFKGVFPDSAFFALLERSCWHHEKSLSEAIAHHELALRIRMGCFGEKHISVLQTLIVIGSFHQQLSNLVEASRFFYRASCIGRSVLYQFSTIVVACTNIFLTCTETITITKRTEIVTYREEMIRFMIEICKVKHGKTSDAVIRWYKVLAKLYVDIKEEHHATVIYQELHEIIIVRFGKGSKEHREIGDKLLVKLKGGSHEKDILQYGKFIFETDEETEVIDELRIEITIKLALEYEARCEFFLAEQLYINFWRRISEVCRNGASVELQMAKISIAIAYAKFLHRIKRVEEASNILICLWAEYEHHKFESELLIIRIKEIGVLCRTFGLLSVAVSIFSTIWGYFKSIGKHTHEEALSTTILITEVVEELTETRTTTTTTVTTETTTTETVVREVFETTFTRCKHGKVDRSFFKSCLALVSLYISQQKWSEVEIIVRRSLEVSWKAVLTVETDLKLTGEFVSEIITLVTKLAICHHKQGHFEKAEFFYLRLYRACLTSFHIEDVRLVAAYKALVAFYEEHHRHEKTIEIYVEILDHYRKHLGHSHTLTIQLLYTLGSLCVQYGRKDAYEYYIEIVTILNKNGKCHKDAFEACLILSKFYYIEKRWTELQKTCAILWEAFVHHHHEFTFTAEMIQVLYERYVYVLEHHAKVEFSVLYKLTVEYRETVTKFFGVTSAIVTVAMLALAEICERSEKHWHESVTIYEEVVKRSTTTTTKTIVTTKTTTETVKKRLSKLYVTIITKGSVTCTHETIERAIGLCVEIYAKLKIELGCWHETTLLKLKELILLYKKAGHISKITDTLQICIIEVLTQVTTSITLYQSAITIAGIFIAAGQREHGLSLLHQLRHLILLHDIGSKEITTIHLGGKVTKVSFVFLAAFEHALCEKVTITYSEIMADILTETILYEQYTRHLKTETKIEVLLQYGAQLRAFWVSKKRTAAIATIDAKLFDLFIHHYGAHIKTKREVTFTFYEALVIELGKARTTASFSHHALVISTSKVLKLLEKGEFQAAHDVAQCAFQFLSSLGLYSSVHGLSHGYKLAELLAGRDKVPHPSNPALRDSMLALSRTITTVILEAARKNGIDFVALKFEDVNGLVGLLGAQKNYAELETLLTALWTSREVQKTWTSDTVLAIGNALVHAHQAAGHGDKAIALAEDIAYNLRRSRGPLDMLARRAGRLLASLYTAAGRHKDAMGEYDEVLREIDEEEDQAYAPVAREEIDLLKRTWMRNKGWDKSERNYRDLFERLSRLGIKEDIGKWKMGEADGLGKYVGKEEWTLSTKHDGPQKKRDERKRASDLWVCGYGKTELIRA